MSLKSFRAMYALCDGNNFFVSCERMFNSALEGKPVIVLSNNDGCAIARSEEAKALGIKMGANYFEIENFAKRNNIQVFSTNFTLYADMSIRMKGLFARFSPIVEDYSIDEAFLDFTGFEHIDLRKHCLDLVHTVKQGIGIPVSVGVAPTKTLAKIANRFAKKYPGYQSVCMIDSEEKRIKALKRTEIGDVWGIGRRHSKRLLEMGIHTAYDFTQCPREWVRKRMTVVGERTWRELRGEPCLNMLSAEPDKQSITITRGFGKKTTDLSIIKEATATYACMAAAKLRKQKSYAKSLLVFITTDSFRTETPQYSEHIIMNLPVATNSSIEIVNHVSVGLEKIFLPGYAYKKTGVILMDICRQDAIQGCLWDRVDREKHKILMNILDCTNDKFGRNALKLAALGDDEQWKIKQERLSPCYTTKLKDFPKIKG